MDPLFALTYVSSATRELASQELDLLLEDAREFNQQRSVTGALLHHEGCFFQYLEGPRSAVQEVYRRIQHSSKHRNLIKMFELPIDRRYFSSWHMGFADIPATEMQQLAQANWQSVSETIGDNKPLGIKLLMDFWDRARHR